MRSICLFSSYFVTSSVPVYVKFYLEELVKHFSEVVYITNEKNLEPGDIAFFKEKKIQIMLVKNEGYDFGMWYKAILKFDISQYDRIGLVNDSCILFNKLDNFFSWVDRGAYDYCGFTENNSPQYHIQSYFLVISKKAATLLKEYLLKNGLVLDMKDVIITYELGLSDYMIKAGMSVASFYKNTQKYGDPTWVQIKQLIKDGYPFIKKRILARNYGNAELEGLVLLGFDPYPAHYIKLITKVTGRTEIEVMSREVETKWPLFREMKFRFLITAVTGYRALKQLKRKMTARENA